MGIRSHRREASDDFRRLIPCLVAEITTERRIGLHEMARRFETLHDGMFCHRNRDVLESRAAATVTDDTSNAGDTISKRTNKADDTCK